jgi:hypothetical protein
VVEADGAIGKGLGRDAATVEHPPHFGDRRPVFARYPGNYKPASFGFCAQRGGRETELRSDDSEPLWGVIVDNKAGLRVHGATH